MKKVISLVLLLVLAASLGCAQAQALDGAVVGSTVTFGNYEQGNKEIKRRFLHKVFLSET